MIPRNYHITAIFMCGYYPITSVVYSKLSILQQKAVLKTETLYPPTRVIIGLVFTGFLHQKSDRKNPEKPAWSDEVRGAEHIKIVISRASPTLRIKAFHFHYPKPIEGGPALCLPG